MTLPASTPPRFSATTPNLYRDSVRAEVAYGAWLAKQEIRTLTPTL